MGWESNVIVENMTNKSVQEKNKYLKLVIFHNGLLKMLNGLITEHVHMCVCVFVLFIPLFLWGVH